MCEIKYNLCKKQTKMLSDFYRNNLLNKFLNLRKLLTQVQKFYTLCNKIKSVNTCEKYKSLSVQKSGAHIKTWVTK